MGMDYQTMSMGMQGIATATNAWGQYQQGRAREKRLEYQSRMEDLQADRIKFRGDWEEKRAREKGSQVKGAQRAGYAAGNVQVDTGSPLDILTATDREIDMDAAMIRYNAEAEAGSRRMQGGLYRAAGRTARTESLLQAGSTLVAGGSNMVYNSWMDDLYDKKRLVTRKG